MHFYTINGEPRHTQPTKKGAKNPERPTTTKDAKEQGLFPSVTEYIRLLANPAIERYKLLNLAKVCYESMPVYDETVEEWSAAVLEKSTKDAGGAAELGTTIHGAIESHYKGDPYDPQWETYVAPTVEVVSTLGINPVAYEKVLVNAKEGYAGTSDLIYAQVGGERGILDFKSQRFDRKPGDYDSHVWQLAAYHMARFEDILDDDTGYNIYISTVTPGLVVPIKRTAKELRHGWEVFQHLLALYRLTTGFDPRHYETNTPEAQKAAKSNVRKEEA